MARLLRPQNESGWDVGMRMGNQLQQLAAPLLHQKRLNDLRKQQLEDQATRRNQQLEDRDFNRNTQLEDFQRKLQMEQALGNLSGAKFTPITPAGQDGRPASIGALPVQEGDPQDLMVASPGVFISPSENERGQLEKFMREKRLQDLMNPQVPKGFNLSPGEQRFEYDQETKGFKNIASAPGKDAESKTYTLSPGQRVFDAQGREIASIPMGEKESRPMVVPPGSTVIGSDGKEIFKNPSNPKDSANLAPVLKEKANNALSVIEDLRSLIGPGTVGTLGNVGRAIPFVANEAKQIEGKINALKSQISMSELLKMKQSGASFGALSDTELGLLGNSIDTLDVSLQNPESLLLSLAKIEEAMKKMAQGEGGSAIGGQEYGIGNRSGGGSIVDSLFNKHK